MSILLHSLLYLDDIFVFVANISEILDRIKMVLKWLMDFNLKIKQNKYHFFQPSLVDFSYVLSADDISLNPKKVNKDKNCPMLPQKTKRKTEGIALFLGARIILLTFYSQIHKYCNMVAPVI